MSKPDQVPDLREVIASALYTNDAHVHNDPPFWNDGEEFSISEKDRECYRKDAAYVIWCIRKGGWEIRLNNKDGVELASP